MAPRRAAVPARAAAAEGAGTGFDEMCEGRERKYFLLGGKVGGSLTPNSTLFCRIHLRDQGVKRGEQGVYVVWNDRLSNLQPCLQRTTEHGLSSAARTKFVVAGRRMSVYPRLFRLSAHPTSVGWLF